jgi:hypothetical protein
MAETNGHRDNPSRLDRMEKLVEHVINGHIVQEDKLGRLDDKLVQLADGQRQTDEAINKLTVDVKTLHDTVVLQAQTMDRVITNLAAPVGKLSETDARLDRTAALGAETDGKLDRLPALIAADHQNFQERLSRLELQ